MSKVSIAKAAKLFDVSRPTLLKHLQDGKISGEKGANDGDPWQIDMSELKRVYQPRGGNPAPVRHADLPAPARGSDNLFQAELNRLQEMLDAEREARKLVERHLEDLRRLLPSEGPAARRSRWWPF
jgi:hypothetical protein